jgi:hypothetical protein
MTTDLSRRAGLELRVDPKKADSIEPPEGLKVKLKLRGGGKVVNATMQA